MKMCTVYLKDELLDEIKYYMHEGEKVSPFICRIMQEYVEYKKRENSTGITQDLLTLTNTVQRITEYINKGNTKPVTNTNTEHVTTETKTGRNRVKELEERIKHNFDDLDI